jgi:hypothetical protein
MVHFPFLRGHGRVISGVDHKKEDGENQPLFKRRLSRSFQGFNVREELRNDLKKPKKKPGLFANHPIFNATRSSQSNLLTFIFNMLQF